jgi:hypothetical protein
LGVSSAKSGAPCQDISVNRENTYYLPQKEVSPDKNRSREKDVKDERALARRDCNDIDQSEDAKNRGWKVSAQRKRSIRHHCHQRHLVVSDIVDITNWPTF